MHANVHAAHRLDLRLMSTLIPHGRLSQTDLSDLRSDFARALTSPALRNCETLAEAWNRWTGAAPGRAGHVRFRPTRCHVCQGRRYSPTTAAHNLSRTGSALICGECRGSGQGQMKDLTVLAFPTPPSKDDA